MGRLCVAGARPDVRPPALLVALALAAAACGGEGRPPTAPAPPRSVELNWTERSGGFRFHVRRLLVTRSGWAVDLAFRNETDATFLLSRRAHRPLEPKLGLVLAPRSPRATPPVALATRFRPPLPRAVRPRQEWSGRMGARRRLPAEAVVRVFVGRFARFGSRPRGLPATWSWVSTRSVRVAARAARKEAPGAAAGERSRATAPSGTAFPRTSARERDRPRRPSAADHPTGDLQPTYTPRSSDRGRTGWTTSAPRSPTTRS